MVTGRPPFRANNVLAVLKRVAEDTPRPIREITPETPQWLCEIINKLHAKKADRAKLATNSLKLNNQTAAQVAAIPGPATTLGGLTAEQIEAAPGPANAISGLLTVRSVGWSNPSDKQGTDWYAKCQPGEKAIAGGWDEIQGNARFTYNRPTPDDTAWWVHSFTAENTAPASGSIWVVCSK